MVNKKKFHNKSLMQQPKKVHDPGLMAAVEMANYQLKVKKRAIRELTVNKEVDNFVQIHRGEVEDEFTSWLYGSFALALHRKFGFGAKRIADLFNELQSIKNNFIAQEMDCDKIWDIVREEVKLDIVVDEEW